MPFWLESDILLFHVKLLNFEAPEAQNRVGQKGHSVSVPLMFC